MRNFSWLHFSDLHLNPHDGFDIETARRALLKKLADENFKCDYVFITGDIAHQGKYDAVRTQIHAMQKSIGGNPRFFWAVGNHDIPRGDYMRNLLIKQFRDAQDSPMVNKDALYEFAMENPNPREVLTKKGMAEYIQRYEDIFEHRMSNTEVDDAHFVYGDENISLVVLNTCLTSKDNEDEHKLMIVEQRLHNIFDRAVAMSKPLFVIGHHGRLFFHINEQSRLATLFERAGVDCYFCGHSHRVGYSRFNDVGRDIHQITCGGGFIDGYSVLAFLHGTYDMETKTIGITPYTFAEKTNKEWNKDNTIIGFTQNDSPLILSRLHQKERKQSSEPSKSNHLNVESDIFLRSKKHYNRLCKGSNARFAGFEFDELLFTDTKPFAITVKDSRYHKITIFNTLDTHTGNFVFIGEGGSGKTTALLHIWNEWNERGIELPLYVPLNEVNISKEDNFIFWYLKHWYGVSLDKQDIPVILLLDGFNEIIGDPNKVLLEIKILSANPKLRIVLTSRYDFIGFHGLESFSAYEIQPLDSNVIREFLAKRVSSLMNDWERLLSTPMMLTLYSNICAVRDNIEKMAIFPFKQSQTKGELIYNYLLCQLGKLNTDEQRENLYSAYIAVFHIAPYIAWCIETEGVFSIEVDECERAVVKYLIENEFDILSEADIFLRKIARQYRLKWDSTSKRLDGLEMLDSMLIHTLRLLSEENTSNSISRYSFRHQHFRDFLSALHIDNAIRKALSTQGVFKVPEEIKNRMLPSYIIEMLSGYYGEYLNGANVTNKTRLHELINAIRGKTHEEVECAINNIIVIWKTARDNAIIGENLTQLDFSHVPLYGIVFSNFTSVSDFDGSIISDVTFLPQGHSYDVHPAIYSKDGRRILSASYDKTIIEWDKETGACLRTIRGHSDSVTDIMYSTDEQRILSSSWDGTVREWNRETGECLRTFIGHSEYGNKDYDKILGLASVRYSKDERNILAASWDGTVKEWNSETGQCIRIFEGHTERVFSAVYSRDEQRILSASEDGTVKEWDRQTGKCIRTIAATHKHNDFGSDWVKSAIYSEDESCVLTVSGLSDNTIKEWCRETGVCLRIFEGHSQSVNSAIYNKDGKRILSASSDSTVKEWDRETCKCIRTFKARRDYHVRSGVDGAIYSKNELRVLAASSDNCIQEWDRETGVCLRILDGYTAYRLKGAVYSEDGKGVISCSEKEKWGLDNEPIMQEWDIGKNVCINTFEGRYHFMNRAMYSDYAKRLFNKYLRHIKCGENAQFSLDMLYLYEGGESRNYSAAYSKDCRKVIVAHSGDYGSMRPFLYRDCVLITEWDCKTKKQLACFVSEDGIKHSVNSVMYSKDEKRVLSASDDKFIKEWIIKTKKCIRTFEGHSNGVTSAIFSEDEQWVLSSSRDGTIKEWNVQTMECHYTFRGHFSSVLSAVYSDDGLRILSASSDGTIKEWDRTTGKCLWTILPKDGVFVSGCGFTGCHFLSPEVEQIVRTQGGKC